VATNKPRPLGLVGELPPADGISPYAGGSIPGSLGAALDRQVDGAASSPAPGTPSAVNPSIAHEFSLDGDTYRLRRTDVESRLSFNEVAVPLPQVEAILRRALAESRENLHLLPTLEAAASQLAGLHSDGVFVLTWLRPETQAVTAGASAPAPISPAALRAPAPPPLPVPEVVEFVMGPAQAAALKSAAAIGAPFCEECARLAAAQSA
jgi:hypothetical protein